MRYFLLYILIFVGLSSDLLAQNAIDTILLPEVQLEESRLSSNSIGTHIDVINHEIIGCSNTQSFSDFLSNNTAFYIKRYGALSTSTFRGTTSAHTLVLWNEVPLNSIANGLADLSIVPIHSFNKTTIVHGGDGSIFGSGALGGSIHINSVLDFNDNNELNLSVERGSFGLDSRSIKIVQSNRDFAFSAFFHTLDDINNFTFINTTKLGHPKETNKYGRIISDQKQFNLLLRLSKDHVLKFNYWGINNDREVPQNMSIPFSDAKQYDVSDRFLASSKYKFKNINIRIKQSYVKEDFNYTELSKNIDSYYIAKTHISDIDIKLKQNNQLFNAGVVLTKNIVSNNNYHLDVIKDNSLALIGAFQKLIGSSKFNVIVRKEWHSVYEVPIVPTIAFETKINSIFRLRSKYNMNFRSPTFNDRYWVSSGANGNLDLLPENSWNKELGLDILLDDLIINTTVYSLDIKDMILWQTTSNQIWQPNNVRKVWSRGLEIKLKYKLNQFNFESGYCYTKSTNEDQLSNLDISKGKQLLYVPLHKAYASLIYSRDNAKIILNQSYNGSVLTSYSFSGDEYLDEFLLTDISLSKKITSSPIYISIKIKNLFDSSYQTYSNYPNSGREYILTLNYKLN